MEIINALGMEWDIRERTKSDYISALHMIVSEIIRLGNKESRHDYHTGGRDAWLKKVHAMKLAEIPLEKLNKWKTGRLRSKDQKELKSTRTTLRKAKSLFGPDVIDKVQGKIVLSSPLPFQGVKLEKGQNMRYISNFNAGELLEAALSELNGAPLKIIILCLLCGLRQREADMLPWDHVDTERWIVRVEATKWYALKSETSRRRIGIPTSVQPLFLEWKEQVTGDFFIKSGRQAKVQTTYPRDRCKAHFDVAIEGMA